MRHVEGIRIPEGVKPMYLTGLGKRYVEMHGDARGEEVDLMASIRQNMPLPGVNVSPAETQETQDMVQEAQAEGTEAQEPVEDTAVVTTRAIPEMTLQYLPSVSMKNIVRARGTKVGEAKGIS